MKVEGVEPQLASTSAPVVPRIRRSPTAGAFLDGANAASLSMMVVVTCQLGHAAIVDPMTIALLAASLIVLMRSSLNSAWLVFGGAMAGLAVSLWR